MPKRSTANSATIPPPVNGWNTRDPISGMDPLYAVDAENFIGKGGGVELRDGTLIVTSGMFDIFGAVGKVTGITPVPLYTSGYSVFAICGFDNVSGFQSALGFNATGATGTVLGPGAHINNLDYITTVPVSFKGSCFYLGDSLGGGGWYMKSWDGIAALETAVLLPDAGIEFITTYRNRLYGITQPSGSYNVKIYYGNVDSVAAMPVANVYSIESLLKKGGKISYIGSLTRSGVSSEELFIVISALGEVLVFSGEYPASPTWALIGHYYTSPPCGTRCFINYGADLLIFTVNGLVSLLDIMQGQSSIRYLSDAISSEFAGFSDLVFTGFPTTESSSVYFTGVWWQEENLIILSYPTSASISSPETEQLVYHVPTNSWWKWTGLGVYSMATVEGRLLLGSDNGSILEMTGDYDEDPNNAGQILTRTIKLRPAYNYFGDRSASKQFVEARPILKQSEGLSITMDSDVDYQDTTATNTVTDTTDTAYKLYAPRIGLRGIGRCASIRIDGTVTTKRFRLEATEVIWNDGDI